MKQHVVEFTFRVDTLRASLFKSYNDTERELGIVSLDDFSLLFTMAKYTMTVDVDLKYVYLYIVRVSADFGRRSLGMDIFQTGRPPCQFITSATSNPSEGLLAVRYRRVQPESPVFTTLYDGINQNVDVKVTTVIVRAAPEPVIALYDFIMTTFVPEDSKGPQSAPSTPEIAQDESADIAVQDAAEGKIKVAVKLAGIRSAYLSSIEEEVLTGCCSDTP